MYIIVMRKKKREKNLLKTLCILFLDTRVFFFHEKPLDLRYIIIHVHEVTLEAPLTLFMFQVISCMSWIWNRKGSRARG